MRHNALLCSVAAVAFDNTPAPAYQPTPAQVQQVKQAQRSGAVVVDGDPMLKRSSDSAYMLPYWDMTDAIVDGVDAMRLAQTDFLPRFADEENTSYDYRLTCTKMTNIYRDTVEGLASKPFEQEVELIVEGDEDGEKQVPEALTKFIEDVDGSGNNLTVFAGAVFFNGINSAIDWIYVDYPKADPSVRTIADAKRAGLRPYWSRVLGRNVLEVRSAVLGGNEVITYMRIFEPGDTDRVRVFEKVGTKVTWTLYKRTTTAVKIEGIGETVFAVEDEGALSISVIPLTPFMTGRRDGRTWRFFPAMRDAADLQVNLYQNESGLEYIKRLAAYPMLAGNGVKPDTEGGTIRKLAVGPGRVLYAPPNGNGDHGQWSYVEPAATSMKFLAEDIAATKQDLRELGRQPLTAQSGNLTVITTAVAAGKAKSAVSAWALNLKNALENAMTITCEWLAIAQATYDPVVQVFTEFDQFIDGKDLEALQSARDAGDISQETYWFELKRRGVLSPEFDVETEEKRLLAEVPSEGEDLTEGAPEPRKPKPVA